MRCTTLAVGVLLSLAGCAGANEVIPLKIQALPSLRSVNQNFQNIKVVIEPFEESADAAGRVGARSHLGGGETIFTTQGGSPGVVVAQVVADNLHAIGFQVWVKKSTAQDLPAKPDITITGQVRKLWVQARSRFFSTKLVAEVEVAIHAANASDSSTARLNLEGSREDAVFWFEPGEAQELLNRTLKENLDKLMADIRVQDRALLVK